MRVSKLVYDHTRAQIGAFKTDNDTWVYIPTSEATGNALPIKNIVYDTSISSLAINVYGDGWHYIRITS